MKFLDIQELEKLENAVHESQEAVKELQSQKVSRVMSCYVAEKPSGNMVILLGLKFEELEEKESDLVDRQIYVRKRKKIREEKYRIFGYEGDIEKIKEIIREFFKSNSKTQNTLRINKPSISNEKLIEDIKEFVKHENNNIDFPPAKIRIRTCNLDTKTSSKSEYADTRSEAYYGLRELFKKEQIEFVNVPELKTKILNQFSTISFENLPDGKKKAVISDDLSYEFVDALVYLVWRWGLVWGFV